MTTLDWKSALRQGLQLAKRGEFERAEAMFALAYELEPDRAETCYALGQEAMRKRDFDNAEPLLRKAWHLDPSLSSAAAQLARCLGLELGRSDEALHIVRQAMAAGQTALLRVVEMEVLVAQKRFEQAEAVANLVLQDEGASPLCKDAARRGIARTYRAKADALAAGGEMEASAFLYRRAAALDPNWSEPITGLAQVLGKLGKSNAAQKRLSQACEQFPQKSSVWLERARLYLHDKKWRQAETCLQTAQAVEPTALGSLLMARLYLERKQVGQAVHQLEAGLSRYPGEPTLCKALAKIWFRLGEDSHAKQCLAKMKSENDEESML